jgi:hypothetical protein
MAGTRLRGGGRLCRETPLQSGEPCYGSPLAANGWRRCRRGRAGRTESQQVVKGVADITPQHFLPFRESFGSARAR